MPEYVNREELVAWLNNRVMHNETEDGKRFFSTMRDVIRCWPAFEGVPVVKGRWLEDKEDDHLISAYVICSVCGDIELRRARFNYCPICGADMRGESDDN